MKHLLGGMKLSEGLRTASELIVLSLLWTVCCLPVITIGAATTAMYRAQFSLLEGEGHPYRRFFLAFREIYRQATVLWLIYAALAVVLYFDLYAAAAGTFAGSALFLIFNGFAALIWLLTLVYVFALEAEFDGTVAARLRSCVQLSIKRLPWSLLLIALLVLPLVLWLFATDLFWHTVVIWPLGGFGLLFRCSAVIIRRLCLQEQARMEEAAKQDTRSS